MQPPSEHLRVTGCQALDAHQAFLLHVPEKQVQALSQSGGVGDPRPPPARGTHRASLLSPEQGGGWWPLRQGGLV